MKSKIPILVVVCILLLTACGTATTIQPTTTFAPPTATLPPTLTPTPEPTFTPTATPTPRLPVAPKTQIPAPDLAISADNLDQVVELARWGKGVITDAVYSPDGKFIAVATTLGVTIYQADTLEEKINFETNASVNSLAASPNGETIASGLTDNTVKLWKASDGTLLMSFESPKDETEKAKLDKEAVTSVSFSPDGKLLVVGSTYGTVRLWQVSDGALVNTLKSHARDVTSVFFSPDGQALFSASKDGKVRMVNVADGKPIRSFGGQRLIDSGISADGKILFAYDQGVYSLILWDIESGKKMQTIKGIEPGYSFGDLDIAFSPDGQSIIVGFNDYAGKIWNVASGAVQTTFEDLRPKDGWYYRTNFAVDISPDGQSFLMAGSNVIGIWDLKKNVLLKSATIKSQDIYDLALTPDGKTLISVEGTNVNLWQISDGNLIPTKDLIQSNGNVAVWPDGKFLMVPMFDYTARLWPLSDQGTRRTFEMEKREYIGAVAISSDSKTLALGTTLNVELRKVSDGALLRTIYPGLSFATNVAVVFSPDGEYLACEFGDLIKIYQVSDGKLLKSYKGVFKPVFSPDGTLLAAGGTADNSLKIWKIPSGDNLFSMKDLPNSVTSLTFSPDNSMLVTGSAEGTIEIFLTSDGTLLKSWEGHPRTVSDLIFTSDGKLLISSSYDGTIRMWGLKP
jgi:WD40 repeat protein